MSQLGLMVVAIGLSAYNLSLFHLFCHAMFKALLFMSAGSIIHSVISESQDIRTYGGFIHYLPVTYICILIASLSLMAFPGLTGYYSKDIIIESTLGSHYFFSGLTFFMVFIQSQVDITPLKGLYLFIWFYCLLIIIKFSIINYYL